MISFSDIKPGTRLRGLAASGIAEIVQVSQFGQDALNVVYRLDGRVDERLVMRGEEAGFEAVEAGRSYAFDADGALLRLASEAYRIRLAYLFDPYLAVTASQIEALPHQITAVYGEMLPRQPLRFLLADDPGAGKTVMAGLLIKELLIRGDLERCLIVAPGGLVEQWQEEMAEKFGLAFEILTRDQIEASLTGNPFAERQRLIVRLDMTARSDELQAKMQAAPEWDLVIVDEAHRMAASYTGGEVKETRRHKLGRMLGGRTRNLLLMSATPHNGKEADFQLFMGLLDADRFEGRFREGVHKADVSDMLRRMTKEELYRFDGTPLFPERRAYTASYSLSPDEANPLRGGYDLCARRDEPRRDGPRRSTSVERGLRPANLATPLGLFAGCDLQITGAPTQSLGGAPPRGVGAPTVRRRAASDAAIVRLRSRRHRRGDGRRKPRRSKTKFSTALPPPSTSINCAPRLTHLKELEDQAFRLKQSGQDAKWRELVSILDELDHSRSRHRPAAQDHHLHRAPRYAGIPTAEDFGDRRR